MQIKDILLSTKPEQFLSQSLANVFGWLLTDSRDAKQAESLAKHCNVKEFSWMNGLGYIDVRIDGMHYDFTIQTKGDKWRMMIFNYKNNHLVRAYGDDLNANH